MAVPGDRQHPYRQYLYRILADRAWLDSHIQEIIQQYSCRWIAVYQQQVIAVADTPEAVREICSRQVDPDQALIFNVPSEVHTPI